MNQPSPKLPTADAIHVIVISSVRPEPTSAGQIILYRHLVDQPGITLEVYGSEPKRPSLSKLVRRIAGRLSKTRLCRIVEDFWVLWGGRWIDAQLPSAVEHPERTVILTVAHGDGFRAAQRFAKRHRLPLVAFFHDWWPDMVGVHQPAKWVLERKFKDLARDSAVAFCVCEGMRDALGPVPNAVILPPIPADQPRVETPPGESGQPFKIVCSGNLGEYGKMLGDVLEETLKHPEMLLQVRGSNPSWSEECKVKMGANGRWLDYAPRAELDAWLASADAFLVPMVFDPTIRRRMETSFPSKLIEFAQFGKPIVIWGPDYCSAVRWARNGFKALCVTDPNSHVVIQALLALRGNPPEADKYAASTRRAASTEFNPEGIQQEFSELLVALTSFVDLGNHGTFVRTPF